MPLQPCKVRTLVLSLAVGAAGAGAAGTAGTGTCRGGLNVSGLGAGLYASGHGGDVHNNQLAMHHNSGFSITTSCKEDWDPHGFKLFKVLGKTLTYTIDLSKVGCACNVAVYFLPLPARDLHGQPSKGTCPYISYYCDAHAACGQSCPELDLMQANKFAFAATPRKCEPPVHKGHYTQCDHDGCGQNTNSMGVMDYGPGAHYTIDTTRPFEVHTDFYGSDKLAGGEVFTRMVTRLEQGAKKLQLDHSSCTPYLSHLADVMAAGMSLRIAYWGKDARTMSWLDDPPCSGDTVCSGDNAGKAVISNIRVVDHPEGEWHPAQGGVQAVDDRFERPSELRVLEQQEAVEAQPGWLARLQALQSNLVHHRLPSLVHQLRSLPEQKVGMLLVGVSVLFCIPGIIAVLSYYVRQPRNSPSSQRNLVVPIQGPQMQTYAVNPKVFPVRQDVGRGGLASFFGCCCRRNDIQYAAFTPRSDFGGRVDVAEWNAQRYSPRPQVGPYAYHR